MAFFLFFWSLDSEHVFQLVEHQHNVHFERNPIQMSCDVVTDTANQKHSLLRTWPWRSMWGLIQEKQNFSRCAISRWTQEVSLPHVLWHGSMLTSSGVLTDSVVWIKRGFAVDPLQHTGYKSQCEAGAVTTAHLSSYTHTGFSPVGPVAKRVQSMWPQVLDLNEFWSSRRTLTTMISWLATEPVFSLDTCPGKFQLMDLMTQTSPDLRPALFTLVARSRRHRAQLEERIPVVKEGLCKSPKTLQWMNIMWKYELPVWV